MKLTKKVAVAVESQDGLYNFIGQGINLKFSTDLSQDGFLELIVETHNPVLTKEIKNEEITAVLAKIEKYNTGKMTDKEIGKMNNKVKNNLALDSIGEKFSKDEELTAEDVKLLQSQEVTKTYLINYDTLNLVEEFIVVDFQKEVVFPAEDFQEELESQFKEEKLAAQIEQNRRVAEIMGTSGTVKKRSVTDYLLAKKLQIAKNEDILYKMDLESPIPQANDLARVLSYGKLIADSHQDRLDLDVLINDAEARDVHYYYSALCFLGLVYKDDKSLCLTYAGENFFKHNEDAQKTIILDILTKDPVIAQLFDSGASEEVLADFAKRGLNQTTAERRIVSLLAWKKFLVN